MNMPPLCHNPFPDRPFTFSNSHVIPWIQENINNDFNLAIKIFQCFKKQCLSFDHETRLWKGIKHYANEKKTHSHAI